MECSIEWEGEGGVVADWEGGNLEGKCPASNICNFCCEVREECYVESIIFVKLVNSHFLCVSLVYIFWEPNCKCTKKIL